MEEFVGGLWNKLITRAAYRGFPAARVELGQIERMAPVFFRALGGDTGLTLRAGSATAYGARRSWMERVAGIGEKVELAWTQFQEHYQRWKQANTTSLRLPHKAGEVMEVERRDDAADHEPGHG